MATLTGTKMATFCKSKIGTPYVYGAKGARGPLTQSWLNMLIKMYPKQFTASYQKKIKDKKLVGKTCTDCSGLVSWYTGKEIGSSQLYSQASKRIPISNWKDFPIGTVVWKSGHVGVYLGDGQVVEAKGINYGTVQTPIESVKWKYGLLFSWIQYDESTSVNNAPSTSKGTNPYTTPTVNVKKGMRGENVKWVQWELVEAGYDIQIDGVFGTATYNALVAFQKSCKLTADGICGVLTRRAMTATNGNSGVNPYSEPKTNIKKGNRGEGVKWLQWELNQSRANLNVDGVYGTKTYNALIAFQKAHNLEVDGICGPATRKALLADK